MNYRYEHKYIISDIESIQIKESLNKLACLDKNTNMGFYNVRSLYFDTYYNDYYYENEDGLDPREKYRIRIYNCLDDKIMLERKVKENGKTFKEKCDLTKEEYNKIIENNNFFLSNKKLINKFMYNKNVKLLSPKIIVSYDRIPYVYSAYNIRITIDTNISSSCDINCFFNKNINERPIMPNGYCILEVKFDEKLPDIISRAFEQYNLTQIAFSKYYLCRKYNFRG